MVELQYVLYGSYMSNFSLNLKNRGIPDGNSPQVLRRLFEPPEWFDDDQAKEIISFFPELRLLSIYSVAGTLGGVEALGKIPEEVENVFEFGSGWGEGLVSLDMFARHKGGAVVTGSESDEDARIFSSQVADLLPSVQQVKTNGISALVEAEEQFDVVVANMFGPSYDNETLPSRFIPAALKALKSAGVIIINSDSATMGNINSWAQRNLAPEQVEAIDSEIYLPPGLKALQPHTVIKK